MTDHEKPPAPGEDSVWGRVEESSEDSEAPGIWHVITERHGGLYLSPERRAVIPDSMKVHAADLDGAFWEEDSAWSLAIVCLFGSRPQASLTEYEQYLLENAEPTAKDWYPDEWESITGRKVSPGESHMREEGAEIARAQSASGADRHEPGREQLTSEPRADMPQPGTRRARARELDDLIKQQDEKHRRRRSGSESSQRNTRRTGSDRPPIARAPRSGGLFRRISLLKLRTLPCPLFCGFLDELAAREVLQLLMPIKDGLLADLLPDILRELGIRVLEHAATEDFTNPSLE